MIIKNTTTSALYCVQKKLKVLKNGMVTEGGTQQKLKLELGDGKFVSNIIHFGCWNINGLRSKIVKPEFQQYVSNPKLDIICFNETRLDEEQFIDLNLKSKLPQDYSLYLNCCKPPKKGYSGVAILSKVKPLSVKFDLGHPEHDLEGRAITAEYEKFYLVCCYVPNAGNGLVRLDYRTNAWDVELRKYVAQLKEKKPTIVCGDMNVAHQEIDIHDPIRNAKSACFTIEERNSFTELLKAGFKDTFRELHPNERKYSYHSTRAKGRSKNRGWRLDYFLISEQHFNAVVSSEIIDTVPGDDHIPVEMQLDISKL